MNGFLSIYGGTVLVGLIVAGCVAMIIAKLLRDRRKAKAAGGACGGCSGCCGGCQDAAPHE